VCWEGASIMFSKVCRNPFISLVKKKAEVGGGRRDVHSACCLLNLSKAALDWPRVLE
jgi:hypothetical protein